MGDSNPVEKTGHIGNFAEPYAETYAPADADPDLVRLVAVWPTLPNNIRRAIVSLILPADGDV